MTSAIPQPLSDAVGQTPLVTIALPVYNGAKYIHAVLDCIAAQTFRDYEFLIVDNGSTDATGEICRARAAEDSRIRYVRYESTIPAAANYRRAAELGRGHLFLWNAADDERPSDAVERAVDIFRRFPSAVMVHGPVDLEVVSENRHVRVENEFDGADPDAANRVAALCRGLRHNGMLYGVYRRDALLRIILRPNLGHDFLVCVQMAMLGPIHYVADPLIRYRHVFGPVNNPVSWPRQLSLRGLLAWPTNRFKSLIVLGRGCGYLLHERQTPLRTRIRCAAAYAFAFIGRFRSHLLTELAFAASAPLAWILRPLIAALKTSGWGPRSDASRAALPDASGRSEASR